MFKQNYELKLFQKRWQKKTSCLLREQDKRTSLLNDTIEEELGESCFLVV